MLENYFPILVFIGVAVGLSCALLIAGRVLSTSKPDDEKLSAYECGFEPFDESRAPFSVKYYLIAILFILFDLETAFFFPWAVVLRKIGWFGFSAMMMFLLLLVVGFIYEWRKGALEWE